jgi:hypothetical protein
VDDEFAPNVAATGEVSVKHVQRMLGHKDAAMTLTAYASLFEPDLDDFSARLDAALLEAAAACMRPEPSAEIIDLPREPPEHEADRTKQMGAPSRIRTYDTRFRNRLVVTALTRGIAAVR